MAETLHSFAELATILVAFSGGMIWVTRRIEKGQKTIVKAHKKDFAAIRKSVKKRRSIEECDRLRSECPCNQQNIKGKER